MLNQQAFILMAHGQVYMVTGYILDDRLFMKKQDGYHLLIYLLSLEQMRILHFLLLLIGI